MSTFIRGLTKLALLQRHWPVGGYGNISMTSFGAGVAVIAEALARLRVLKCGIAGKKTAGFVIAEALARLRVLKLGGVVAVQTTIPIAEALARLRVLKCDDLYSNPESPASLQRHWPVGGYGNCLEDERVRYWPLIAEALARLRVLKYL